MKTETSIGVTPEKITVEVTAEDIAKGEPGDGCKCPIAIAVRRATGLNDVSIRPIAQSRIGNRYVYLPDPAKRFVLDFDEEQPVQPFTFEIDLSPTPTARTK